MGRGGVHGGGFYSDLLGYWKFLGFSRILKV